MDEKAIRFALERRACLNLRKVLQLKLQQRRTTEALVSCGVMPSLKSLAGFHEQTGSLERAQNGHCHKRKITSKSGSPEPIRMHILDGKLDKPELQAKQLQQKKVLLSNDLNNKITHRPGPIELIHKNILPVDSCFKQAITERRFPKASGGNSSYDEDSNDSLSPRQTESREHPLGIEPARYLAEKLSGSNLHSLTKCPRPTQKHKKTKDDKPKIKKLKYHQYIPPDKKGDTDPLPDLDSSYAKILQQQQLFLQLQILSQQQHNYHAPLPAPPKDLPICPSSSSKSKSTSLPPDPSSAPSTDVSVKRICICPSSAPLNGTKVLPLHLNLDEMKVAELKSELKLRRLRVSGTRKDLIERLRTNQELSQGGNAVSSQKAGGTTEPELETAGTFPRTGGGFSARKPSSKELLKCAGDNKPIKPSLMNGTSPEGTSFNSEPLGELTSSPVSGLNLQLFTTTPTTATIKQEPRCSRPAPCHFPLKSAPLQKHSVFSSADLSTTTATPPVNIDQDRMLQEKDKQIAELTRMLWQHERLVEILKMQLRDGNRDPSEEQGLKRVKEETADRSNKAISNSPPLFDGQISGVSPEKEVVKIIIKEEHIEAEIGSKILAKTPDTLPETCSPTPITQNQMHLQLQPEHRSLQRRVCLQESARQLAQQQGLSRLLLMQQQNTNKQQHYVQRLNQEQEIHQNPHLQRQKKFQNLHQQIQMQRSKHTHSQLQQNRPKQQFLLRKQACAVDRQLKKRPQQTKKLQPIQTHSRIRLQQQDLRKYDSSLAMVTDSKSKHIHIPPTNHIREDQESYPDGKASNYILLQSGKDRESVKPRLQEVAPHPSVQPSQQPPLTLKISPSPFYQTEMFSGLDALLSPLSPDSVKTAASPSPDNTDKEDFIDFILQAGETPNTQKVAQDFSFSSPSPSPLQLLLSPPESPSSGYLPTCSPLQHERWTLSKTTDYKQHLDLCGSEHLEDFLESTTEKSLLEVKPSSFDNLFHDLDSQMLCNTNFLDMPRSPIDSFETGRDLDWRQDSKKWLGEENIWETLTLVQQTPPNVFSADFLDSSDLHLNWDY